ncbi:MAG: hypothetical protein JHC93_07875 [Parachlamydiales bacterium]|nr:hypothetical protein [Parachlamydiales bacterium]
MCVIGRKEIGRGFSNDTFDSFENLPPQIPIENPHQVIEKAFVNKDALSDVSLKYRARDLSDECQSETKDTSEKNYSKVINEGTVSKSEKVASSCIIV